MNKELVLKYVFMACAFVAVAASVLIFAFVTVQGVPILSKVGLWSFLSGTDWLPTQGRFGILPMIVGTFVVTLGALLIGAPLAVATALFLSEVAPRPVRRLMRPAVELLAGVPSVVYGFFGIVVLVPLVRTVIGGWGYGLVAGWLVLAVMIVPTIAVISEDALKAVPRAYREASLAMGATRWQTIHRVVVPAASGGILTAVVLGMGRAIGETMAVLMVLGNAPIVPTSIHSVPRTLTSAIILDMSYATGDHQTALFAMGTVLLVISMGLIALLRMLPLGEVRK